jgi:regulator of replication initiation timing
MERLRNLSDRLRNRSEHVHKRREQLRSEVEQLRNATGRHTIERDRLRSRSGQPTIERARPQNDVQRRAVDLKRGAVSLSQAARRDRSRRHRRRHVPVRVSVQAVPGAP